MINWKPISSIIIALFCGCNALQDELATTSLPVEGTSSIGPVLTHTDTASIDLTILANQWGQVAVDPEGGVLVAQMRQTPDDPEVVEAYRKRGYFELRHINASGAETWARTVLGFELRGVIAPSADQPVLFGGFSGTLAVDRLLLESVNNPLPKYGNAVAPLTPSPEPTWPSLDGVVIGFDQGSAAWAQTFKGAGAQEVTAAGVLPNGDLLVGGSFVADMHLELTRLATGEDDVHSPILVNPLDSLRPSAFLARLSSVGEYRTLLTIAPGRLQFFASNDSGAVAAVTQSELPDYTNQQELTFISNEGQMRSVATWPSIAATVTGLAQDNGGNVYIAAGADDFHDQRFLGELLSNEAVVAKLNHEGTVVWFKRFPALHQRMQLAVREGKLAIAGEFTAIDFGGGELRAVSSSDLFLAQFDLDGNHQYSVGINGGTDGGGVASLLPAVQGWVMEFYVGSGVTIGGASTKIPEGEHLAFWNNR